MNRWVLSLLLMSSPALGYQGGGASLRSHNHTGPADGGTLSNINVTGTLHNTSTMSTEGVIISSKSITAQDYITAGTSLTVTGPAVIGSTLTVGGAATVVGSMSVVGAMSVAGALTTSIILNLANGLQTSTAMISGTLTVVGSTTLLGTIFAPTLSTTTFYGSVVFGSTISVSSASYHNDVIVGLSSATLELTSPLYGCMKRTANNSLANNTETAFTGDSIEYNSQGFLVTATNDRFVVQGQRNNIGFYQCECAAIIAFNTTGNRQISLKKNNSVYFPLHQFDPSPTTFTSMEAVGVIHAINGDILQCMLNQDSGGPLNQTGNAAYNRFCCQKIY